MNKRYIMIIIILVLILLGVGYCYKKYKSTEIKEEDKNSKNTNVEEANFNELNSNNEIANTNKSNSTETNKNDKNTKTNTDTSNLETETVGRIEVSTLNIKEDILSTQIKYTTSGLNEAGNTVIYVENAKYKDITNDTEIYIRNMDEQKTIYKVYNIYETDSRDISFYTDSTDKVEVTLLIDINEGQYLVIQANKIMNY